VISWLNKIPETQLYLSVLTLGELYKGIHKLPDSKRKQKLESWLDTDLKKRFHKRIIIVDLAVAAVWG
jgi:toxin FitB